MTTNQLTQMHNPSPPWGIHRRGLSGALWAFDSAVG